MILLIAASFASLGLFTACGGGGSGSGGVGPQPVTSTITVKATSGDLQHLTTFSLTVDWHYRASSSTTYLKQTARTPAKHPEMDSAVFCLLQARSEASPRNANLTGETLPNFLPEFAD